MKYNQGAGSLTTFARLGVRGEAHVLAVTIEVGTVGLTGRITWQEDTEVVCAESEDHFTYKMLRRAMAKPFERWRRVSDASYVRKSLPPPSKAPWLGSTRS